MDNNPQPAISPQELAAVPSKDCPKCGRRMQVLNVNTTTYSYACYGHTTQNSDSPEPYYLNVHKDKHFKPYLGIPSAKQETNEPNPSPGRSASEGKRADRFR